MNERLPEISVIIPMYNAEKYIEQCLDSVMSQTSDNFEVIVIDDCSTDQSVSIVEKMFDQHRGGLIRLRKNTGGAAVPRNVGLRFSRGKYIAFLDNDDMFTRTALAELYPIAEATGADILHAQRFFQTNDDRTKFDATTQLQIMTWEMEPPVTKPELVKYDIGERVKLFAQRRLLWNVWNKLFRRDFITQNCIEFPNIKLVDDMLFCFQCFCLSTKYYRIPNVFNVYRVRDDSHSHKVASPEKFFVQSVGTIKEGTKILSDFMNEMDFFRQHGEFKHIAIEFFVQLHFFNTIGLCTQLPPHVVESLIKDVFAGEIGNNSELMSYLFNNANFRRAQLEQANKTIAELQSRLAART